MLWRFLRSMPCIRNTDRCLGHRRSNQCLLSVLIWPWLLSSTTWPPALFLDFKQILVLFLIAWVLYLKFSQLWEEKVHVLLSIYPSTASFSVLFHPLFVSMKFVHSTVTEPIAILCQEYIALILYSWCWYRSWHIYIAGFQ